MKIKILFSVLLLTGNLFLLSCKKEKIDIPDNPTSETPVFHVSGTIGNSSLLFQAGVDNAYLENFNTTVQGVNRFGGRIIQGENYVEIALFDGNLSLPNSDFPTTSSTISLSQSFSNPLLRASKLSCSNVGVISDISFSVNGVNVGNALELYEPGVYNVCSDVTFLDGSSEVVCNEVIIGYKDLGAFILNTSVSGNTVNGSIQTDGDYNSIDWYVDGVLSATNSTFSQQLSSGLHQLKAEVHFNNGITRVHSVIVHGSNGEKYFQDINVFKSPLSSSLFQDFKAEISIRKDGIIYKHVGGSENSNIVVTSYAYYGKSPAGIDIYKITGIVTTELRNLTTNEILNANFNVVFGLEIP